MTFDPAVAIVNIVEVVAKITVLRCILVSLVNVTILTTHIAVVIAQWKIRFGVIKYRGNPGIFDMTILTFLAHAVFV